MAKVNSEEFHHLFETVLRLENVAECEAFFDDLCTVKELQDLSQRLAVAGMLDEKKSYAEITETTGASTATISRVSKALNYGSDGYRLMLDRMKRQA